MSVIHTSDDWKELERHKEPLECCEHGAHRFSCPLCYTDPPLKTMISGLPTELMERKYA